MRRADFYSRFGARVSSSKYSGSLIYLASPAKINKKIDLTLSGDAHVFSFGCYEFAIPDKSTITLVINNVSPSGPERTFVGVQIIQLQDADEQMPGVNIEISREHTFHRGKDLLEPLPPKPLPLNLEEWNAIHSTTELAQNDNALGASWHGSPLESNESSWTLKSCWQLNVNDCWNQNVSERVYGRRALIQNRLFSFTPAPLNSLGKGIGFEVFKRPSTERMIVRYHSPSTEQKGEVELCFRNCR